MNPRASLGIMPAAYWKLSCGSADRTDLLDITEPGAASGTWLSPARPRALDSQRSSWDREGDMFQIVACVVEARAFWPASSGAITAITPRKKRPV